MPYSETLVEELREAVWEYYRQHGRKLPWRLAEHDGSFDPYKVMVSEIMLQQTQVNRVIPKYEAFIEQFPSIQALANAPLGDVLQAWSGLGYNRRAKYLWQAAQAIVEKFEGKFPATIVELTALLGVGHNTAAAILVYAYNQPVVFVETNIRTVYIHHFFPQADRVSDRELLPIVASTIDKEHPRAWYWALMDYGSFLKRQIGNISRQSSHYQKQSTFKGSLRQIRGRVIALLAERPHAEEELSTLISDKRLAMALSALLKEDLIIKQGNKYSLH